MNIDLASTSIPRDLDDRCQAIEGILLAVAEKCCDFENNYKNERREVSAKAKELIDQRKLASRAGNRLDDIKASKLLRKELRAISRSFYHERIGKILKEFKGSSISLTFVTTGGAM